MALISVVTSLCASFGSNNGIILRAALFLPFLVLPVAFLLTHQLNSTQARISVVFATFSIALFILYMYQFRQYTRSPLRFATPYTTSKTPGLTGVHLPESTEELLQNLHQTSLAAQMSFATDAIILYSDLPGVAAALRWRAVGNPFLVSVYDGMDHTNCFYLRKDTTPYRHVFLIQTRKFSTEFATCFQELYKPAAQLSTQTFEFQEYRIQKLTKLTFSGPFIRRVLSK